MNKLTKYVQLLADKHNELAKHSIEVSNLATSFGKWLGLSSKELTHLRIGGLIHDIGKFEVPEEILNKRGKLTVSEYESIKKHTSIGYELLTEEPYSFPKTVLEIVQYHHERVDGKGYPKGLKKDKIPYLVKIVSLCDVYSAITNKRVYKEANSKDFAMEEIEKQIGKQFDEELGYLFLRFIKSEINYV